MINLINLDWSLMWSYGAELSLSLSVLISTERRIRVSRMHLYNATMGQSPIFGVIKKGGDLCLIHLCLDFYLCYKVGQNSV